MQNELIIFKESVNVSGIRPIDGKVVHQERNLTINHGFKRRSEKDKFQKLDPHLHDHVY